MTSPTRPRRVFITGASDGLGAALAAHYATECPDTILGLVARRQAQLNELAERLPCHCRVYALDVTDVAALRLAAEDFIAHAGLPDIVIANAGISIGTLAEESLDLPVLERVLAVNLFGTINTLQPFITAMRQARRGQLVGIASVAGLRGLPGAGAYCASKAALIAWLESLRIELHGSGVGVSTLLPGYIATRMTAQNPYPMPFLLPADTAARRIARLIDQRKQRAVMPWQMALVAPILRWLPGALFDRIFAGRPRKPRLDTQSR
jgi:NAD(P)-dependent dehydrogenase (short-subunit alcohol dehydrogenase family)